MTTLPTPRLHDRFGRVGRDLRVSVIDRCNLRCTYCMPAEGLDWLDKPEMLTDDELVRLYRTAAALVFPSLYEGFGQPPLEAMACGCPVVAARAGALPEVCGDAARYVDPVSPESIAEGVADVLDHPGDLVPRGLERAKGFTWEATARGHEAVYRELAS